MERVARNFNQDCQYQLITVTNIYLIVDYFLYLINRLSSVTHDAIFEPSYYWTSLCSEQCSCFVYDSNLYQISTENQGKLTQTGRLERELQMVQLCATRCSCIAILWASLVSFAAIALRVASQRVFIFVCFVMTQSGNFWIHPRTLSAEDPSLNPDGLFVILSVRDNFVLLFPWPSSRILQPSFLTSTPFRYLGGFIPWFYCVFQRHL
jgi:hypothetical protein